MSRLIQGDGKRFGRDLGRALQGQIFIETVFWIVVGVFICLSFYKGFQEEFRSYRRTLERKSGMPHRVSFGEVSGGCFYGEIEIKV